MAKHGFYSEEQWLAILGSVGEISAEREQRLDDELSRAVTRYYDRVMDSECLSSGVKQRNAWKELEQKANEFRHALAAVKHSWPMEAGVKKEQERLRLLADEVGFAGGLAEWHGHTFEQRARSFSGRQNPDRKELLKDIFRIWTDVLGRELGISRNTKTKAVQGPLWSFFNASLSHILREDMLRGEGFRLAVNQEKKERAQLHNVRVDLSP